MKLAKERGDKGPLNRYQTTYKELKLTSTIRKKQHFYGYQTTYKELKLNSLSVRHVEYFRYQTTYKELKLMPIGS